MDRLPPFLQSCHSQQTDIQEIYQHAHFAHAKDLGLSHALWWPARDTTGEICTLLLFIPGNPGLAEFYIPFLSFIYGGTTTSKIAILAHSLLDHHGRINNGKIPRYTPEQGLTIQVESSIEILDAIGAHYPKARVIVVGHSVGSWISLQMLKSRPNVIAEVFFLFPTLSNIAKTPNGKLLSPVFSPLLRRTLSLLSPLLGYLPIPLFTAVYPTWPISQLIILRNFLSSGNSVLTSLSMAKQEMETILELDVVPLEQYREKLYFYYGQRDDWIGEEKKNVFQCLESETKSFNVVHGPAGVPHAFCINRSDSEVVAQQCKIWLENLVQ